MVERDPLRLSIVRRCELVSISRSGFYHRPAGGTALNLALRRLVDTDGEFGLVRAHEFEDPDGV